jgi:membrane glycosyltransferase
MLAAPLALPWAVPVLLGLCLAIPFAVLTTHPTVNRMTERWKLCAIPDEISPPESIRMLQAKADVKPETPLAA